MFNNLTEVRREMEPRLFRTIHREAIQAVKEIKTKELKLIRILQEVDENFVYRYFEFDSLYQYCLHALDLTEAQSMMYISVARKSKQLPALQRALEAGEVTVSKVKRVVPVIDSENQEHWLELVRHSSKRVIEKEVAKVNPRFVHPEKTRYLTDTIMELQTPLSEEVFELVKRAQEVISQKSRKPVKMEDVIQVLAEYYLKNEDPIEREKRREVKTQKKAKATQDQEQIAALSPCPGTVTQTTLPSARAETAGNYDESQSKADTFSDSLGRLST